jgi:hypothetical protein
MAAPFEGPALLANYNYSEFTEASFGPLMRFEEAPPPGSPVRDFQLTMLQSGERIPMQELCRKHLLTVFEFGSVT